MISNELVFSRILLVRENSSVSKDFRKLLSQTINGTIMETTPNDALSMLGKDEIDVVFLFLPSEKSQLFHNYFALIRSICNITPIIGVTSEGFSKFTELALDDIVHPCTDSTDLRLRLYQLKRLTENLNSDIVNWMYLHQKTSTSIMSFGFQRLDFLPTAMEKIVRRYNMHTTDLQSIDLFILNHNDKRSTSYYNQLRTRYKNVPILFIYDESLPSHFIYSSRYTVAIKRNDDPISIEFRIKSYLKYYLLYKDFSDKLQDCLRRSTIDATTEVFNRSFLDEYLQQQSYMKNIAMFMVDIDKFKNVNDEFGHTFADYALKHTSKIIKQLIRSYDIVARYGGDEFVIVMNNVDRDSAISIAERIRKQVENTAIGGVQITVSIGLCWGESMQRHDAMAMADKFMYLAKQCGGNTVKICA